MHFLPANSTTASSCFNRRPLLKFSCPSPPDEGKDFGLIEWNAAIIDQGWVMSWFMNCISSWMTCRLLLNNQNHSTLTDVKKESISFLAADPPLRSMLCSHTFWDVANYRVGEHRVKRGEVCRPEEFTHMPCRHSVERFFKICSICQHFTSTSLRKVVVYASMGHFKNIWKLRYGIWSMGQAELPKCHRQPYTIHSCRI